MRSTYGNSLGGVPKSSIPAPDDEIRYSSELDASGQKKELIDWRLYFKSAEDGGILPEYDAYDEKGEFGLNDILYAFKDIRVVPALDETNKRITTVVNGVLLPGRWDLVADLYCYLRRDVVVDSQGTSKLKEIISGIIKSDILLSSGELEYTIENCGPNSDTINWYYKFDINDVESLSGLQFKQKSNTTNQDVDIVTRIKEKDWKLNGRGGKKYVPLAKRGSIPKALGFIPESGEYVNVDEIETWDSFTRDLNRSIPLNDGDGGYYRNPFPITQNIIWQSIWKTWMGWKFDEVSVDPTNPRLDDGSDYQDGALLPLEVDGHPLKSDFAPGYYIPSSAKWLRISTRLGGYTNICRGRFDCFDKLTNDDCSKIPFTLIDAKRRPELDEYTFVSKDTSRFYPIPGKPCYQGLPAKYDAKLFYEYTSSKECFDGKIDSTGKRYGSRVTLYDYELVSVEETITEWENIIINTIDKNCECYELSIQNPPYIDPNDPNRCNVLHTDTIYTICPDDGMYYYKNREIPPNSYPSRLEIRHIDKTNCKELPTMIYHPINIQKDLLHAMPLQYTNNTFNDKLSLTNCFTSSIQSEKSKFYYTDIVIEDENSSDVCFSLLYANKYGSGSLKYGIKDSDSPSKSNYSQYSLLTRDSLDEPFSFFTNGISSPTSDDFFVMKFSKKFMKDRLDVGNFQISLKSATNEIFNFIDNSMDITNSLYYKESPYTSFDLVSGSLLDGIYDTGKGNENTNPNFTNYGKIYPNLGIIIFDSAKLENEIGIDINRNKNVDARNEIALFDSIKGAIINGNSILSRTGVQKITTNYFIKIPPGAANYSNNPTFADKQINGYIYQELFYTNPITYITTIGLYNDSKELVAVAKLSKPLKKHIDETISVNVKLNI
jgi:hypothetical protein